MTELEQINAEYFELQKKREELLKEKEQEKVDEFLKLEWTKNCYALLEISPWVAAGLPTYILKVGDLKDEIPKFDSYLNSSLTVMGNSRDYQQNITYHSKRDSFATFETSNHEIFIKFIQTVKFKEIRYNEKHYLVLEAIKNTQSNKNE